MMVGATDPFEDSDLFVSGDGNHCLDDVGVPLAAGMFAQDRDGTVAAQPVAVVAGVRHCVVGVAGAQVRIYLVDHHKAAVTEDAAFEPRHVAPDLEEMAGLSAQEFKQTFRDTPVERARHRGFLRNVAVAMGNSGQIEFEMPLRALAAHEDAVVREHAEWGLSRLV